MSTNWLNQVHMKNSHENGGSRYLYHYISIIILYISLLLLRQPSQLWHEVKHSGCQNTPAIPNDFLDIFGGTPVSLSKPAQWTLKMLCVCCNFYTPQHLTKHIPFSSWWKTITTEVSTSEMVRSGSISKLSWTFKHIHM